ncbi:MAG: protein kinase [Gemmatimonadetes bacterium]|nr:protein kinase [Gemmatimonadota bacterium]NIO33051.1 protein kinase [Gemmatimonadota bacterium]
MATSCLRCAASLPHEGATCPECGSLPQAPEFYLGAAQRPSIQEELLDHLRAATSGEFEILGEIGHGGMARVYLAQELALDRQVAVKVLSPLFSEYPEIVKRFQHEARTAGQLNHPHIVPVFAVYQGDGLSFFTMPFVRGASFREIIHEDGPLELEEALEFLRQAGSGLAYAHQHGVIHRDVKPENMMLEETTGRLVLTDFGLAKALGAESLTVPGDMIGTPHYMAPEQLEDNTEIDGRCDEYSLAMVAYEMLAGEHPFGGGGFRELLMKQLNEDPSPLQDRRPDLPEHVCHAIHRALSKSPDERFDTVEEFAGALLGGKPIERRSGVRSGNGRKRSPVDTKTVWMRDRLLKLHKRRRLVKWTSRVALSAAATLAIYLGVATVTGSGPPLGRAANDPSEPTEDTDLGAVSFADIDLAEAGDAADLQGPPEPPVTSEDDRSEDSPARAGGDQVRLAGSGSGRQTSGRAAEATTREDRSTTPPAAAQNEERAAPQRPPPVEPEVSPAPTNDQAAAAEDEVSEGSNPESPDSTAAGGAQPGFDQPEAGEPVPPRAEAELVTADMVVERYRRALETEDVEELGRLYGGEVPSDDLELLTRIFDNADDLQVSLRNRDTRLQGDLRLEDVDFEMRYVLARTGRSRDFTLKLRLTLEEGPAGWQLVRLDRR